MPRSRKKGRWWRGLRTFLLALILLAAGVYFWRSGGENGPASPVRDLAAFRQRLEAAAGASPQLSIETLGYVDHEAFSAPLWIVRFKPEGEVQRRVLLTGGVHGNEPAGPEVLLRRIEALARNPDRFDGIAFDIVPLVNPWGWVHDRRHNAQDRDINRDFASFKTPEAKMLRDCTLEERYDLIVDHHEDPDAQGFYLYQIANEETDLCRRIINGRRDAGDPIEQHVRMYFLKVQDGLIDAPYWSLKLGQTLRLFSLVNYLRVQGNSRVFLIESPTGLDIEERIQMHQAAWDELAKTLGSTS